MTVRELLARTGCVEDSIFTPEDQEEIDDFLWEGQQEPHRWTAVWAGEEGNWVYLVTPHSASATLPNRLASVSRATTAVAFSRVFAMCNVHLWEEQQEVTSFEVMRSYERSGNAPDRLLPLLEQVGCFDGGLEWEGKGLRIVYELTGVQVPQLTPGSITMASLPAIP